MALNVEHKTIEEVPEEYRGLYSERGGKYVLTGITGVKTQGDLDRVNTSLSTTKTELEEVNQKLGVWGELTHEDVVKQLDTIPELQAAAGDKLDAAGIDAIVDKRVEGVIRTRMAPLEREIGTLKNEGKTIKEENFVFREDRRNRKITSAVRTSMVDQKIILEAQDDILLIAANIFELRDDDGAVVTKDNVGVTPGLDPMSWLLEIADKKPHWYAPSQGGGGKGSGGFGGVNFSNNPWSSESWNMTKQGEVYTASGKEKAQAMAKAAGTTLGGARPSKK